VLVCIALTATLAAAAWLGRDALVPGARADGPDPEEPLDEFVPSEKVPADTAVAFPVDI
jgi:hypothetical protein